MGGRRAPARPLRAVSGAPPLRAPFIALVGVGGTIASVDEAPRPGAAKVARVSAARLLPPGFEAPGGLAVEAEDFASLNSFRMTPAGAVALARRIAERDRDPACRGVVVAHGTDTMEESAWVAELAARARAPVVFTGAARAADGPDPDGPGNLADAVALAADPGARGAGALICFAGAAHAARHAVKIGGPGTFASPGARALARVAGGAAEWTAEAPDRAALPALGPVEALEPEARVPLLRAAVGDDGALARAALAAGARGLVVEAFGQGNLPEGLGAALAEAARAGTPVVVATRCVAGRVGAVYGGPGGAHGLAASGAVGAGALSADKARLLLMLLLGAGGASAGADAGRVAAAFEALGGWGGAPASA